MARCVVMQGPSVGHAARWRTPSTGLVKLEPPTTWPGVPTEASQGLRLEPAAWGAPCALAAGAALARKRRRLPGRSHGSLRRRPWRQPGRWAAGPAAAVVARRCEPETVTREDAASLVFCFDFDGVVCDSVNESSMAAWLHARRRWPELELGKSPKAFLDPMRTVRPVVETGWENTLLIRVLSEAGVAEMSKPGAKDGRQRQVPGVAPVFGLSMQEDVGAGGGGMQTVNVVTSSILSDWNEMRETNVQEWSLNPEEMIKEFGEVRDRWIAKDRERWLSTNQPYEGVPDIMDAMLQAGAEVFIITTKQRRFCQALLDDFGLEFPSERLFALEDGPKTGVLRSLLARPELAGKTFHFVEDKLETLRKVAAEPGLEAVRLHFADWGYNTARDRKIVGAGIVDKVSLLSLEGLEVLGGVEEPWLQ